MAVVIGAATTVSFGGSCVISANWGSNPNIQRLYCLDGSWDPYLTIEKPTETLSLTVYAPGPTYSTSPTTSCSNANTITASVSPAECGGDDTGGVSGNWYVTSYSYSKEDGSSPGQESWSLIKYITTVPDYVLRGITEGQSTTNTSQTGITFDTTGSTNIATGSVSAGGIGRSYNLVTGTISSVGGGSSAAGVIGQGSASIPYTPLYI